jgi:preprotein translocase subunit SecE
MTEQVQETSGGGMDIVKLGGAIVIVIAGMAGYYFLSAQPIWVRWLVVLAALVLAALVAFQSTQGKELWQFIQSSRVELRKVVWPTQQETLQVTVLVFVVVVVLGLFFWGLDVALGSLTQWLTGRGA